MNALPRAPDIRKALIPVVVRAQRINIDVLYIAQAEKDQALSQSVQALRGYWLAYDGLRLSTLYDFERDRPFAEGLRRTGCQISQDLRAADYAELTGRRLRRTNWPQIMQN